MALDKTTLKSSIVAALESGSAGDKDAVAQGIADAIYNFVKSGTVSTTVATAGTAAAQAGTGTGTIS